jgi:5-formyltetrahydrofolate cyclo-ligase
VDDKPILRASGLRRRAARSATERASAGALIAAHGLAVAQAARVVAAHVGVGTEPPTQSLLEALVTAGVRVLLPAVDGHLLRWGELRDWSELRASPLGLLEPARTSDEAQAAAGTADLLLVPALAVDRAGYRLGRGGGFYDRWLAGAQPRRVLAVLFDDEIVDRLPHEPHDRRVDAVLTPSGVVTVAPATS